MLTLPPDLLNGPNLRTFFPHTDANLPRRAVLGWERQTRPSYSWRGLERPDGPIGIFQYTLSGCGVLERQGVRHVLEPGQAFLVEVPDDHHYYLPDGWEPWEFIFLCFDGADLLRHVHWLLEQQGPIFTLAPTHQALTIFTDLADGLSRQRIPDAETLAISLYQFVLALRRTTQHPQPYPKPPIARAVQYIAQHFADDLDTAELAQVAGISRAHFCRIFHQEMTISPLEYLTTTRLERALCLLRGTMLPLDEIAGQCGFASASYLGKVFRKAYGITPTAYRQGAQPVTRD